MGDEVGQRGCSITRKTKRLLIAPCGGDGEPLFRYWGMDVLTKSATVFRLPGRFGRAETPINRQNADYQLPVIRLRRINNGRRSRPEGVLHRAQKQGATISNHPTRRKARRSIPTGISTKAPNNTPSSFHRRLPGTGLKANRLRKASKVLPYRFPNMIMRI